MEAKGIKKNWSTLLLEDLSLTDTIKGQYRPFFEHYVKFLNETQLTFGESSLETFIDNSCEEYKPGEDRKKLWLDAKAWFLLCHAEGFESQLIFELRRMNYAFETEKSYVNWAKKFMIFHDSPKHLSPEMISEFLTHLSIEKHLSENTQKSALNALVFFVTKVFDLDVKGRLQFVSASQGRKIPEVLSAQEVQRIFFALDPTHRLMCALLYGSGLRSVEMRRLRIRDINIDHKTVSIYGGKHGMDRMVMLPNGLSKALLCHINHVRTLYDHDRRHDLPGVCISHALAERDQHASVSWDCFWLFPSSRISKDPRSNIVRRHHVCDSSLRKAIQQAKKKLNFSLKVSPRTFRHCFGSHMLDSGNSISKVQDLMGHSDVRTTKIYLKTMRDSSGDVSCMDTLGISV